MGKKLNLAHLSERVLNGQISSMEAKLLVKSRMFPYKGEQDAAEEYLKELKAEKARRGK